MMSAMGIFRQLAPECSRARNCTILLASKPRLTVDYQDPQIAAIYEMANPMAEDAEFYLSLAGPRSCSVLDLGCGTGTLCCALAERGHRVTGVDPAAAMLALARNKPYAERVEWVDSSAQTYRSQRRFDLIVMTGHAFQCSSHRCRCYGRIGDDALSSQAARQGSV
jgi:SAM-dependent methyltransferase